MEAKQPRPDEMPETTPPRRRGVPVRSRDLSKRATIQVLDGKTGNVPFGFARALAEAENDAEDAEIAEQFGRVGNL